MLLLQKAFLTKFIKNYSSWRCH